MANPRRKTLHIPSPSTMEPASATQARDTKEPQSQKSVQASSENDSDAALDTSPNTKSSEPVNGRSKMKKKRGMKRAV